MRRIVVVAVFASLLCAGAAHAEPGGPAPVFLSPANGALLTTSANQEITVEYTCPSYVQKNVSYEYSTNWSGYHVVFADNPEMNPSGEFATPYVVAREAPYPTDAAEDVCRSRLPSYFGNRYGTYYMRIERDQITNCGSSLNNCREAFPIQSFTTAPPVATPAPAPAPTPAPPTATYIHVQTYAGCGLGRRTRPSSRCALGRPFGAFLKASQGVRYTICVRYPNGAQECARNQLAEAGTLYVNSVKRVDQVGRYEVRWIVEGRVFKRFMHLISTD